jgi:hypothetical protein
MYSNVLVYACSRPACIWRNRTNSTSSWCGGTPPVQKHQCLAIRSGLAHAQVEEAVYADISTNVQLKAFQALASVAQPSKQHK